MSIENTPPPATSDELRPRAIHLLHLAALACLAFSQQLLDLLGRTPEFFVIRGLGPLDVVVLALVLCLGPGAILAAFVGGLRRLWPRLAWPIDLALMGGLATVVALQAVKSAPWEGLWPLAFVAGVVLAWLYHRYIPVQQFFTLLSPALLIVPALFLLGSDVRRVLTQKPAGVEPIASGAHSPIVFVVFDEWSYASLLDQDGALDRERLPHLAAFADRATWVRGATAASDVTELALPAILSGQVPEPDKLPRAADHPRNLFTLFGDYRIHAIEPITRLCPAELNRSLQEAPSQATRQGSLAADLAVVWLHLVVPAPYDARLPSISQNWQGFLGPAEEPDRNDFVAMARGALVTRSRDADFRGFVAAIGKETERTLYFGHFLLPHVPLEYLPSGRRYLTQGAHLPGIYKEKWQTDPWLPIQAFHRYRLQVQFVDSLLGEMFSTLERRGLFDSAVIVLMADHGASFRAGRSRRVYSPENAADIVPIPLFFKAPGQNEGRIIDQPVSAIDVLPTILDTLDVTPPSPLDGRSFSGGEAIEQRALPVVTKYSGRLEIPPATRREWATEALRYRRHLEAVYDGREELPDLLLHRDLIGRSLTELPTTTATERQALIDGAALYGLRDLGSSLSPAWVSGALAGAEGACCPTVAVAVGGRILATTRTYEQPGGGLRFAALLPEDAFGGTEATGIAILEVRGTGRQRILVPLTGHEHTEYRLELGPTGAIRALASDGRTIPMTARIDGYLQRTRVDSDSVTVAGWAVDLDRQQLVQEILVFYRGELVSRGATSLPRETVVESLGNKAYFNSGFELTFPRTLAPDVATHGIRALALTANGAGELGLFYDRIVSGSRGEYVSVTDGREIPLVVEGMAGQIQHVEERDGRVWLVGWSVDVARGEPAERVVLFLDGRYSTQFRPGMERPAVAKRFDDPGLLLSGFNVPVAPSSRQLIRSGRLRVVAISAGNAGLELLMGGRRRAQPRSGSLDPTPDVRRTGDGPPSPDR